MNPATRHKKLLENKKVERWYSNVKARSQVTSDTYLRNFGLWLEYLRKDPENIVTFARDQFEDFKGAVSDQIRLMESKGTMGSSISTSIKALISYLKFNNVIVRLGINIKNENRNLKAEKEIIPSKDELSRILRIATMRERVSISLMTYSGLRPEVLGNIDGTEGLTIGDIIDLNVANGKVEFANIPAQIAVKPDLSKIRTRYFTFIGPEGSEYLKEYLETRIANGERLTKESPVILPIEKQSLDKKNKFLMTVLLHRRIKATITKAGFDWRPYIFRIYFGTNLDTAESKGFITHPWRQFIMGHKGDIEETYTKREGMIDEGRNQYAKCLEFIETEKKAISEQDSLRILKDAILRGFEITPGNPKFNEKEREELFGLGIEEFQDKLRDIAEKNKSDSMNNGNKNKIIPVNRLTEYLDNKWELVQIFPRGDKAVIKLPS